MTEIAQQLQQALVGGSLLALPLVFLGGVLTALNPCCAALYPAAAASCCATRGERREIALLGSTMFVTGMALATSLLGVVASATGAAITGLGPWAYLLIALFPLLFGMHLLGLIRLPSPKWSIRAEGKSATEALVAGFLFWLVLAPCGTPVLAAALSYAAYEGNPAYGAVLLFIYALGVGVPILILATGAGAVGSWLDGKGWRMWVDRATGGAMVMLGLYLLWIA